MRNYSYFKFSVNYVHIFKVEYNYYLLYVTKLPSLSAQRLHCNGGRRVVYSDSLFPGVFWPFARSFIYRLVSVLLNYMIWQSIGTFVFNLSVNKLFYTFFSV